MWRSCTSPVSPNRAAWRLKTNLQAQQDLEPFDASNPPKIHPETLRDIARLEQTLKPACGLNGLFTPAASQDTFGIALIPAVVELPGPAFLEDFAPDALEDAPTVEPTMKPREPIGESDEGECWVDASAECVRYDAKSILREHQICPSTSFAKWFRLLVAHRNREGNFSVSKKKDYPGLGKFVENCKSQGIATAAHKNAMIAIGFNFNFDAQDTKWNAKLNALKTFHDVNGTLVVKTTDDVKLYRWITKQRDMITELKKSRDPTEIKNLFRKLDRRDKLAEIGFPVV